MLPTGAEAKKEMFCDRQKRLSRERVEQACAIGAGQPSSRRQLEVRRNLAADERVTGGGRHPALHEGKATVGVVRLGTGLEYQLVVDGCCGNTVGKA